MITINNLKKYYDNKLILDIPNLSFHPGNIFSLLGKNGAGKTTLLKILSGLLHCDEGDAHISLENTILCPQEPRFFKGTVLYNLTEPFNLMGKTIDISYVHDLLEKFQIDNLQNSRIETLSGGEKAKVQFIRTILYNKKIILLDEPTASIDKKSTILVEEIIKEFKTKGCLVILITHDYEQALRVSDYIYEMDEGRLIKRR